MNPIFGKQQGPRPPLPSFPNFPLTPQITRSPLIKPVRGIVINAVNDAMPQGWPSEKANVVEACMYLVYTGGRRNETSLNSLEGFLNAYIHRVGLTGEELLELTRKAIAAYQQGLQSFYSVIEIFEPGWARKQMSLGAEEMPLLDAQLKDPSNPTAGVTVQAVEAKEAPVAAKEGLPQ